MESGAHLSQKMSVDDSKLINHVAAKSYGIKEVLPDYSVVIHNVIRKNSPMPNGSITYTECFGVATDNQPKAIIEIYESDSDAEKMEVDEKLKLGDAEFIFPPGMSVISSVFIMTLTLDSGGKLHIHGEAETDGVRKEITVNFRACPNKSFSS